MLPLWSNSRFQLGLGVVVFGVAEAEGLGITAVKLDVPVFIQRGWPGVKGKEGVVAFGGAEYWGITPVNLDDTIGMLKGFLAAVTRGLLWLDAEDKEEVGADWMTSVMIRMKSAWERYCK